MSEYKAKDEGKTSYYKLHGEKKLNFILHKNYNYDNKLRTVEKNVYQALNHGKPLEGTKNWVKQYQHKKIESKEDLHKAITAIGEELGLKPGDGGTEEYIDEISRKYGLSLPRLYNDIIDGTLTYGLLFTKAKEGLGRVIENELQTTTAAVVQTAEDAKYFFQRPEFAHHLHEGINKNKLTVATAPEISQYLPNDNALRQVFSNFNKSPSKENKKEKV